MILHEKSKIFSKNIICSLIFKKRPESVLILPIVYILKPLRALGTYISCHILLDV